MTAKQLDAIAKKQTMLIHEQAKQYLGVRELPGPKTHPIIAQMFSLAPTWLNQDDSATAWCGLFRGFIGHLTGTGIPATHYRAASWVNWGREIPLSEAIPGDTLIFTRSGGNHVTLFDHMEGWKLYGLGGNQSNAVTVAEQNLHRLTKVMRFTPKFSPYA